MKALTVAILKEKLSKLPPDSIVRVTYENDGEWGTYPETKAVVSASILGKKNKYVLLRAAN